MEGGIRRTLWVPNDMDILIERTRKKLGMNRSAFYKYAATRLLEELSVLSASVHEEASGDSHQIDRGSGENQGGRLSGE